jgi:predicted RNA binding protein YcfA (HicA-like mRNA interferase family)
MNTIQVIRLLEDEGWVIKTQKGSHRQYIHAKKPGKITVAFHGKKEIPPWILNSILKQAGLK